MADTAGRGGGGEGERRRRRRRAESQEREDYLGLFPMKLNQVTRRVITRTDRERSGDGEGRGAQLWFLAAMETRARELPPSLLSVRRGCCRVSAIKCSP